MRVMGLDVGDKRIGVSLSDPTGKLATYLTTLFRKRLPDDLEAILDLVSRYNAERIVVGLPRQLDGEKGFQASKVEAFCQELASKTDVAIDFWDERFSTVAAHRAMREIEVRRTVRKKIIDVSAAVFMLQGYLDRQNRSTS
ncbi:MAG: Holliday junction resolvase RuvX [Chloroflexi bacterium]|nr:Holliday junction resolvase RuvX [Chloroflexota bacterium]